MKDLMNYAGNISEELEEAEAISSTKTNIILTFTVMCGCVYTFLCCP